MIDNDFETLMQGIKLLDEKDIEKQNIFDSFLYLESLNTLENIYNELSEGDSNEWSNYFK